MLRVLRFSLAAIVVVVLFSGHAISGNQPPAGQDACLRVATYGEPRHRLAEDERVFADKLSGRGEVLAHGVLRVEQILEQSGYEPSTFSDRDLAWVAVLHGEAYQVGVYRARDDRLERLSLIGNGDDSGLSTRFALAERALAATPQDCSYSFGVLDQDLSAERGGRALYSVQLVDRSRELAWGMHYRFEALDGELQQLDRLHVRCSVQPIVPTFDMDSPEWRDRSFVLTESLPGMDWPTEAQLMQLHLYPDLPGSPDVKFWTKKRVFDFPHGQTRFPERYERKMNPCSLADE